MKWTKFEEGYLPPERLELIMGTREAKVYLNNRYQVFMRRIPSEVEDFPDMVHLSIKRLDKEPIRDWRDMQRIKNELLGPEVEAVELYPAESRLVDTSNQFHLWAIDDPTFRFPFGYASRAVSNVAATGGKQRPFEPDVMPDDLMEHRFGVAADGKIDLDKVIAELAQKEQAKARGGRKR